MIRAVAEQTQAPDMLHASLYKGIVELDARRVGFVCSGGHDNNPPVSGSKVEHLLPGLQAAQPQHSIDDRLGSRIVGSEDLNPLVLSRQRNRQRDKDRESGGFHFKIQYTFSSRPAPTRGYLTITDCK